MSRDKYTPYDFESGVCNLTRIYIKSSLQCARSSGLQSAINSVRERRERVCVKQTAAASHSKNPQQ